MRYEKLISIPLGQLNEHNNNVGKITPRLTLGFASHRGRLYNAPLANTGLDRISSIDVMIIDKKNKDRLFGNILFELMFKTTCTFYEKNFLSNEKYNT